MAERPPKLPAPAQLVVWAVDRKLLTPTEKIVWYHHWLLDGGGADGCYAAPRSLAPRCATTERVIEECRSVLGGLGLLVKLRRIEGKTRFGWAAWIPAIPVIPRTWEEAGRTAESLALLLDAHIRAVRAGPRLERGETPGDSGGRPPVTAGGVAEGASREGGRGESACSASQAHSQLPSPAGDTEEAQKLEKGVFAREREKRGGTPQRLGEAVDGVMDQLKHRRASGS